MILYPKFYRDHMIRRVPDMNTLRDMSALTEFPVGTMLHIFNDNFNMNKPIALVPELDNPILAKEPYKKFIYHVTDVYGTGHEETFPLPSPGLMTTISNYRRLTQSYMRQVTSPTAFPSATRPGVSCIVSYDSLYRARVMGLMKLHRRLGYVLTSVVNLINSQTDRYNIIPIPVGRRIVDKMHFIRSFLIHDRTALKFSDDPWYLFLVQLLGYMHDGPSPSKLEKIESRMHKSTIFLLYTDTKFIMFDMSIIKELNSKDTIMIKFIRLLNELASTSTVGLSPATFEDTEPKYDKTENTSIADVGTDKDFDEGETNNVVIKPHNAFRHDSKASNTDKINKVIEITKTAQDTSNKTIPTEKTTGRDEKKIVSSPTEEDKTKPEPISHVVGKPVRIKQSTSKPTINEADYAKPITNKVSNIKIQDIKQTEPESTKLDIPEELADEKILTIDPTTTTMNTPSFISIMPKEVQKKFNESSVQELDDAAKAVIENDERLTPAQKKRAIDLSQMYKKITINGKALDEILAYTPDDNVSDNKLDFLENEVVDKSMLKSSVATFEHDYISKGMFTKDMVAVMTSFNRYGMFLKNIETEDISDSLNGLIECKAKYESLDGKEHTIRYSLPKIDSNGYCLINGTLKILKKQRVPNPICKVSPTRVTLNSDENKYLVERNTTVAHSFIYYIDRIIEKAGPGVVNVLLNAANYNNILLPYEYSTCARKYGSIKLNVKDDPAILVFDYHKRYEILSEYGPLSPVQLKSIKDLESDTKSTIFIGTKKGVVGFIKISGEVLIYNIKDETLLQTTNIIDYLCDKLNVSINNLSEWTDLKLLNKAVPVVFALCYRYGLSHMLNYTKTKYEVFEKGKGIRASKPSDIIIRFADKTLIIPRVPLINSLIFAGLNNYDFRNISMEELDHSDIYYDLLQSKKISVHNLKGIDKYFDMFVDPMTKDVLHQMGEPTNAKDLLIRATQLLSTEDHKPPASSSNFRFRSYERINSAIYKTLSRAYSTYKNKSIGATNKFSIADFEIKQLIIQDQLMENVDTINPINDIKYQSEYSHAGFGGRQSTDTFMVDDRQFPEDGLGIISEATVDSSKTAYAASMTMDPTMVNLRGMTITKDKKDLEPTQMLSVAALVAPCITQDDGKRANFVSIHLSHYLPTVECDVSRIRTGGEKVVAHRTKLPFAYAAEEDGVIDNIDENAKIIRILYKSKKGVAIHYGEEYTSNGGGGFYCTQNIKINDFKKGDKVRRGDIVVYNDKFFTADPYSKQVDWNIGVLANVACIENDSTLDDGNTISNSLAKKLMFNPVHVRDIVITKTTNVHKYAAVGTTVVNTDPLMIFDQSSMDEQNFGKLEDETISLLAKLNRKTPRAKFSGRIVKIDMYHKCDITDMTPGLKGIAALIYKEKKAQEQAAIGTINQTDFEPHLQIKHTDRIGMTDLDEDTVILRYYIQQDMTMNAGDKIEFDSSLKSITTYLEENDWEVEDGSIKLQGLFSSIGINNRIVISPMVTGIGNLLMEKLEQQVLDMYFK